MANALWIPIIDQSVAPGLKRLIGPIKPKVSESSQMASPTKSPARMSRLRRRTCWVSKTAVKPLISPMTRIGASILPDQDAAPETDEDGTVESVIASEQNTEHERSKRIGRDQPGRLRFQRSNDAAVAEREEELRDPELQIDDSENKKDAGVAPKGIRLIDPELRDGGREEEEREDKISRRLLLLTAKDEKGEPGDKGDEDRHLDPGGVFEIAQHLVRERGGAGSCPRPGPRFTSRVLRRKLNMSAIFAPAPPVLAGERCC